MAFKSIRSNLLTTFLLISLIPAVAVIIMNYVSVSKTLRADAPIIDNKTGYVGYTERKGMDFGICLNLPRYEHTTIRQVFDMARDLEMGESGFDRSGESYLVGDSVIDLLNTAGTTILTLPVQTNAVHRALQEQLDRLQLILDDWVKESEQTDDILVIGFRPLKIFFALRAMF
jgi:hypothetical protein